MKAMFWLTIALQGFFVPWFLTAGWPQRNTKSTALKSIASLLFLQTGLFAAYLHGGEITPFAMGMLIGFAFSLLGDFLLDLPHETRTFIYGLCAFLCAHLCYISAFTYSQWQRTNRLFLPSEVVMAAALFLILALVQTLLLKLRLGGLLVPVACYGAAILMMLVKALSLGVSFTSTHNPLDTLAGYTLCAGAVLFVFSDAVLALSMFGTARPDPVRKWMRVLNITTYYMGQVLMAVSLLWI